MLNAPAKRYSANSGKDMELVGKPLSETIGDKPMINKTYAKTASNRNSLLTGGKFIGIINFFSFYIFTLKQRTQRLSYEQDWSLCLRIRAV
jgi:hypothetical protein